VKKLLRLVGWQLDEWHVVRDARVVDEHGEFLACTHIRDHLHTGIGGEVNDQRTNLNVWERGDELFKPIAATAHDHEVIPVGTKSLAKARPIPEDAPVTSANRVRLSLPWFGVLAA
jgi:hypothetical protein